MIRLKALPVIGVLALAACADNPVQPDASAGLRRNESAVMAAQADGPGTYILSFKSDRIPADLEAAVAKAGGTLLFRHEATGIAIVSGVESSGVALLSSHAELEAMDADGYTELDHPTRTQGSAPKKVDPSSAAAFFLQWNLSAIGAPVAWEKGRIGSPDVSVGILDTGIDYLHPEFTGILDEARSIGLVAEPAGVGSASDRAYADYEGHGTMVANLAASNAVLTAGVTANTRLVSIKVCDITQKCPLASTLWGVLYAADQKLDVINLSLGGTLMRGGKRVGGSRDLIRIVQKVFRYAHRRGVTVVVASGNQGIDMDAERGVFRLYCDAPEVICVSATGPTGSSDDGVELFDIDAVASYANYGRNVTVAAPGGSFWFLPDGNIGVAYIFAACSGFIPGCESRMDVINGSIGTSMSAPQVAGLAALLVEDYGRNPGKILGRIAATSDDFGPVGKDAHYGYGRINIGRALDRTGRRVLSN